MIFDMKTFDRFKIHHLLVLMGAGLVMTSCQSNSPNQSKNQVTTPFVFRRLDLKQRRSDGTRDWDLSSPEARYNTSARTVRARLPKGILYDNDKPRFVISADHATVVNDGELVVLEGSIRLKSLGQDPLLIQGDRLIWRPGVSRMVINQRPAALHRNSKIVSNSLTFQQESGQLLFEGPTTLFRWDKDYNAAVTPQTVITSGDGQWNLNSGLLSAVGPIIANQSNGRQLKAASINGNSKQSFLDLNAPVQLKLEADKGVVDSGETRWDFAQNKLFSKAPVSASLSKGNVRGVGFRIDIPNNTLTILNSCHVAQPDKTLRAQRCTWNWKDDLLVAAGNVDLKESGNEQRTRAEQMEGEINPDGSIRFSPSRSRVKTQINLDAGQNKSSKRNDPSQVQF